MSANVYSSGKRMWSPNRVNMAKKKWKSKGRSKFPVEQDIQVFSLLPGMCRSLKWPIAHISNNMAWTVIEGMSMLTCSEIFNIYINSLYEQFTCNFIVLYIYSNIFPLV